MVELHISYKESNSDRCTITTTSNHNNYKHNDNLSDNGISSSSRIHISPKEGSDNDTNNSNNKQVAKLLVVDDDHDIVHVLKIGLLKNRFLVHAFTNPLEALQSFRSNVGSYCLMLSGVLMPGMTGIQLAIKVKQIDPDIKTIVMTAFEIRDNEFSKVFPSTQVDGFVQKPISIKELTDKILSLIGETKGRTEEKEYR